MSETYSDKMLESNSVLLDMRQAVFNRPSFPYRVGNSTLHVQTKFVSGVALAGLIFLMILYMAMPSYHFAPSNLTSNLIGHADEHGHGHLGRKGWFSYYNTTYPLTSPVYSARGFVKYKIAIISDLDTDSKHPTDSNTWISYLKKGYLTVNVENQDVNIEWDDSLVTLKSSMSYGGRGMELSELIIFSGKLYALDDRTGIVYEVDVNNNKVIPWVVLTDGNGRETKGFKSEWATVKDETLIVGGLGKEWTNSKGEVINHNPQWVKTISNRGYVQHYDWTKNYEKLRSSIGINYPGYMIHESCAWSAHHQKWVFLPRRASSTTYEEKDDEHRGTNIMLTATQGFEDIKVDHVGILQNTHGFSSFKFIPGTKDQLIVALKSEEVDGKVASYIMAFNIKGNVVFPETKIGNYKFEGIEFV